MFGSYDHHFCNFHKTICRCLYEIGTKLPTGITFLSKLETGNFFSNPGSPGTASNPGTFPGNPGRLAGLDILQNIMKEGCWGVCSRKGHIVIYTRISAIRHGRIYPGGRICISWLSRYGQRARVLCGEKGIRNTKVASANLIKHQIGVDWNLSHN